MSTATVKQVPPQSDRGFQLIGSILFLVVFVGFGGWSALAPPSSVVMRTKRLRTSTISCCHAWEELPHYSWQLRSTTSRRYTRRNGARITSSSNLKLSQDSVRRWCCRCVDAFRRWWQCFDTFRRGWRCFDTFRRGWRCFDTFRWRCVGLWWWKHQRGGRRGERARAAGRSTGFAAWRTARP